MIVASIVADWSVKAGSDSLSDSEIDTLFDYFWPGPFINEKAVGAAAAVLWVAWLFAVGCAVLAILLIVFKDNTAGSSGGGGGGQKRKPPPRRRRAPRRRRRRRPRRRPRSYYTEPSYYSEYDDSYYSEY